MRELIPGRYRPVPSVSNGIAWLSAVVVLWPVVVAADFHSGGVATCGACHIMHESEDGGLVTGVTPPLLRAESSSDICLTCHATPGGGVLGTSPLAPPPELGAGNFVFLLEDNLNDANDGYANPIPGHHAGHNIYAPGHGLLPDPEYATAPGGSFPSAILGCTSCHDPHGNDSFRMLRGAGPVQGGLYAFTHAAPLAEGLAVGIPGLVESPEAHTAYFDGVADWCANCHGLYHDSGAASGFSHGFNHLLSGEYLDRYNAYDGEANPGGGYSETAYLPEVPFEEAGTSPTSTRGPGPGARVMCLSCHRAHASSAPYATRWDTRVYRLGNDGIVSGSWPLPNPYADPAQLQLCLKCHDQDHAANSQQSCVVCHERRRDASLPSVLPQD